MERTTTAHRILPWLVIFAFILLAWTLLASLRNPVSLDDGLRHAVMGRVVAARGFLGVDGWSRWFFTGYMAEHRVDPWFLSDALYVPFAALPVTAAVKVFALLSSVLLSVVFLFCLSLLGVRPGAAAIFLFVLLFAHRIFTYRLLLGRPFTVVTAVMFLLLMAIRFRRWWATFALLVLLTLLSHLFVFGLALTVIGAAWLTALGERKNAGLQIFAGALGVLAGILLHPAAGEYLSYLWFVFLRSPFLPVPDMGSEMRTGMGIGTSLFPLAGVAILLQVVLHREGKLVAQTHLFLLDAAAAFFVLQFFVWGRAIDLAWPMTLLVIAATVAADPGIISHTLSALVPAGFRSLRIWFIVILLIGVASIAPLGIALLRTDGERSLSPYSAALRAVPPEARVFNVRWENFPALLAVRPDLRYALAFDPTFIAVDHPRTFGLVEMAIGNPRSMTLDVREFIDARQWLADITASHPSDFLLLPVRSTKPLIERLKGVGLSDVSGSPAFSLFDLREKRKDF